MIFEIVIIWIDLNLFEEIWISQLLCNSTMNLQVLLFLLNSSISMQFHILLDEDVR